MNFAEEYQNNIKSLGFVPIGKLKDLDQIPTESGKLCLGMECLDRDLWEFDRALPLITKIGVHRARLQTGWQKTEREEGLYDFGWLDDVVNKLLDAGIAPFLSLSYGNKLYCNDASQYPNIENGGIGHIPVKYERERTGWQNYVKAVVEHFGDRIDHYEIFNEPDCSTFCHIDMPWTEAYMELVRMTAPLIRKLKPDAKIISCTASSVVISLLADMGIGDYVDIHSFHAYSAYPELNPAKSIENRISYVLQKSPGLIFWRGEAGFPSYNDPRSRGALSKVSVSEIKQAKFLMRHLACDMQSDFIKCTSYFHAYDFLHFTKTHRYHYGVINHDDLSKKPSYECLQVYTHLFGGDVRSCGEYTLSFSHKSEFGMAESQTVSVRLASYTNGTYVFYAYWIPDQIADETQTYRIMLNMPYAGDMMRDPVILDPLTRNIYPVSDPAEFCAPITDYPLFVADARMIAGFADISSQIKKNQSQISTEQFFEQ